MIWVLISVVVGFACGYPHGYLSAEVDAFRREHANNGGESRG